SLSARPLISRARPSTHTVQPRHDGNHATRTDGQIGGADRWFPRNRPRVCAGTRHHGSPSCRDRRLRGDVRPVRRFRREQCDRWCVMSTVEGTVVAITGGGTGIGEATARRYAAEGAAVAVLGRRKEPLERVATETGALPVTADATDREHAERAIRQVVDEFGRVDTFVA